MKTKIFILTLILTILSGRMFSQTLALQAGSGPASQNICGSSSITDIIYTFSGCNGTVTVKDQAGHALTTNGYTVTFDPAANAASGTVTISGAPSSSPLAVTYTVKVPIAGTDLTESGSLNAYTALTPGTITSDQTICYHTAPVELAGVAPVGGDGSNSYQWQTDASGSWANIPSATLLNYQPPVLDVTTSYRLNQTSAICGTVTTNTVTITVKDEFVVGSISSSQTICYHTAPAELIGVAPT
ncbi:MAG TPA: hypothetical protein VK213_05455, partial [Bacteroidales bacterium]|nr:hypothetical protein [Bacteroidales bacterium]